MNILFIGNSHTFAHGIPFQVRELLNQSTETNVNVSMITCGGRSLGWHANEKGTILNVLCNQWDYIFLQQATHPFASKEQHLEDFNAMNDLVKSTGAKIYFCMTWSKKTELEKQEEIDSLYTELANKMNWQIVLISKVWQLVLNESSNVELYEPDKSHASQAGAYLVACMCYGVLTGNSVLGLPGRLASNNKELIALPIAEVDVIQNAINLELS